MIEFKNVTKVYQNDKIAVKNISLHFKTGEFICLIGTSGSGKTTCMRMINGMNIPTQGDIFIDNRNIKKMNLIELRRQIGYVIQQIGLMPHMTIYENICTVPKLLKWPQDKMHEVAVSLVKKVGLTENIFDMYPSELSGGQQQRIGVIRALAANQSIILMDEPFGALDPITRSNLQKLIKELQKELKKTIIFVTHDMDEALQLADRIVIMDKGEVVQFDSPENIMMHSKNEFVRSLIGEHRLNQAQFDYQTVSKIMIKNPITAEVTCSTTEAISMMRDKRVDSLFITDENKKLLGVVDIFHIERKRSDNSKISEYIKESTYMHQDTVIRDAVYYINELGYRNIPIVDDEHRMVGLVTRTSILDVMSSSLMGDYEPAESEEDIVSTTNYSDLERADRV
ncbi:ABC transporter ATP-binding protein [Anaerorhabdus furcosa]|uniref:Quaternary amine transport ATP-binding protein n=1 Tax=Anaerorhabdus furcosa TaxID=118967 RepID=A0A1T4NJJ2_9FIRM|nr:ABC transporter ATP-binding protein [Anaerorhabdus furcosa]SJZ79424.1 osmoprotectant transport system ATP-binding protein [Anaerorhabdus furcosa]